MSVSGDSFVIHYAAVKALVEDIRSAPQGEDLGKFISAFLHLVLLAHERAERDVSDVVAQAIAYHRERIAREEPRVSVDAPPVEAPR